ncbi:MAG: nicotinamidase [Candidatus Omnitrophica bacterium]|nr:nicotinamidase [Candidatus Omnitrophota bacterium]
MTKSKKALLIIDMQNDFCPGGALGVPQGDSIVPVLNRYLKAFAKKKLPIFASRDWHPVKTSHFRDFGGPWPAHGIQKTRGAAFHLELKLSPEVILLYKGMDPQKDSYSVFQAEDSRGVGFLRLLNMRGVKELYVGGLATDYCVKATVLDACRHAYKVKLLVDAVKGVNLKPQASEDAIKKMVKAGAKKITIKEVKVKL